nr:14 kDa proline-rich protein DC2.15-like [Ipomoea batatas]
MAKSIAAALLSIFLTLNLLFFTGVSSASTIVPLPSPFPSSSQGKCPKNALQLGVCADLLNDLLHHVLGSPATMPCCSLISGLVDLEAAVCICTVIKANIIGINYNIAVSLNLLINNCGNSIICRGLLFVLLVINRGGNGCILYWYDAVRRDRVLQTGRNIHCREEEKQRTERLVTVEQEERLTTDG